MGPCHTANDFRCFLCSQDILGGAPIFMAHDHAFCSKICRRGQRPTGSTSHKRSQAQAPPEPLSGLRASRASSQELCVAEVQPRAEGARPAQRPAVEDVRAAEAAGQPEECEEWCAVAAQQGGSRRVSEDCAREKFSQQSDSGPTTACRLATEVDVAKQEHADSAGGRERLEEDMSAAVAPVDDARDKRRSVLSARGFAKGALQRLVPPCIREVVKLMVQALL